MASLLERLVRARRMPAFALALFASLSTGGVLGPARTLAVEPVMDERDINETSVIDALTPDDTEEIVTRGFKLSNQQSSTGNSPGSVRRPAAELLITFATNSSTLTDGARAALDKVAQALRSEQLATYRFRVEGHADSTGAPDANMTLSEQRAAAVVRYLSANDGIAADRLIPVGKGSSEPMNRRIPTAPENRRVTVVTVKE
jgi:outer membrane protein OmpA-like peptidoglycan-associated protein